MKYGVLIFLFLIIGCDAIKKENTKEIKKNEEKKEQIIEKPKVDKAPIITYDNLLVSVDNVKEIGAIKNILSANNLKLDSILVDNNTVKAFKIKVVSDKKEYWLNQFKTLNKFSLVENYTKENIEALKKDIENTFVKLKTTACSGHCPIFNLTIYNDGSATFYGIENLPETGKKEFKISDGKLKKLKSLFNKTAFGTYIDSFSDESVVDVPSIYITHKDKEVIVKLWKDAPDEFAIAYDYIDGILLENSLIE